MKMTMDGDGVSSSSSQKPGQQSSDSPTRDPKVVSIECVVKGSSKGEDEWASDNNTVQTGDIVDEIRIGGSEPGSMAGFKAPFKNGKSGIHKILHDFYKNNRTSIFVRVRRRGSEPDRFAELQACIVPSDAGKKQYVLRSIADPNYVVGFLDRSESDCFSLQASRSTRMVNALTRGKLMDGYVSYPWEKRMQELLLVPNSSNFLSILVLPKASDRSASRYNDFEDTLARANAWLHSAQASGVPLVFMNIQTESLLTKISGETASSTVNAGSLSDLSNLGNASLYGFEDYHGVDIGVVRAVRLWYAPIGGEFSIEIKLKESDSKLGFAISRTEEGFLFISSVIDNEENLPGTRSGLSNLYKIATDTSRLLVISRVSNQKVLPWLVSSTGAIRCYDTVSISQKLSLHRHARVPIVMHVFLWDTTSSLVSSNASNTGRRRTSSFGRVLNMPLLQPHQFQTACEPNNENQMQPLLLLPEASSASADSGGVMREDDDDDDDDGSLGRIERDTAGELSFRFHNFSLSSNWV